MTCDCCGASAPVSRTALQVLRIALNGRVLPTGRDDSSGRRRDEGAQPEDWKKTEKSDPTTWTTGGVRDLMNHGCGETRTLNQEPTTEDDGEARPDTRTTGGVRGLTDHGCGGTRTRRDVEERTEMLGGSGQKTGRRQKRTTSERRGGEDGRRGTRLCREEQRRSS